MEIEGVWMRKHSWMTLQNRFVNLDGSVSITHAPPEMKISGASHAHVCSSDHKSTFQLTFGGCLQLTILSTSHNDLSSHNFKFSYNSVSMAGRRGAPLREWIPLDECLRSRQFRISGGVGRGVALYRHLQRPPAFAER